MNEHMAPLRFTRPPRVPVTRGLMVGLTLTVLAVCAASARAEAAAPADAQRIVTKMIDAVVVQSYEAFLADADATLKANLSRQQFEGLCGLYTQPLAKGYKLDYFGRLKQRGYVVHVWKVAANGAPDEALVRVAMKEGKVGGVWVH